MSPVYYGHCNVPDFSFCPQHLLIPAKAGRMVLFPSELKHMVHPFYGASPRVALAFNITLRREQVKGEGA